MVAIWHCLSFPDNFDHASSLPQVSVKHYEVFCQKRTLHSQTSKLDKEQFSKSIALGSFSTKELEVLVNWQIDSSVYAKLRSFSY